MMYMVNGMAISCVVAFLLNEVVISTGIVLPTTLALDTFAQGVGIPSRLLVVFLAMFVLSLFHYLANIAVMLIRQTQYFQKRQRRRLESLVRELITEEIGR